MGRNYTSTDDEHLINLSVGSDNRPLISHLNTIYGTTNIDLKNYNHTIQLNLHNNKKPITVTIHAKPANMCKDCRMSFNPDLISQMHTTKAQRRNSRRYSSVNQGYCDFVLQAVIISRTIVLMICTCDFNFSQQFEASYLTPKFKSFGISPPRQISPKSRSDSTRFSQNDL